MPPAGAGENGGARSSGSSSAKAPSSPRSSLNDRLKALNTGGDVDYQPRRVKVGDAQSVIDRALNAYEAALAPSADILRRTFGYIYERRTVTHPDSIAYVFDSYAVGPVRICKAWKIVEHPYEEVREVGAVAGSAGIGGAVASNANSPDVRHDNGGRAEASFIQFPCTQKSYTAVAPGSITTPLPRHPDLEAHPTATPSPGPTLAP